MSEILNYKEIQNLLQSLGIERSNFNDNEDYALLCNVLSDMDKDVAVKMLNGAFFYAEIAKKNASAITINSIREIIETISSQTILRYEQVLQNFKNSGMTANNIKLVSKQIYLSISELMNAENANLANVSTEFVSHASKVSSTFSNISKDLRKDLINVIYANCISRMKTFWQRVEADNFKQIIDTLMNDLSEDNFTESELIDLSNKCATIFCDSSREKILGLELVLGDYKDFCINAVQNSSEISSEDIEKLKNFKIGQILRTTASISKANTRTLYHTSRFLQGHTIGEIFEHKIGTDDKNAKLYEEYKDVKLDLSINDMVWVLTKNPSLFTNSITSTLEFVDKIKSSLIESYGDKAKDFDFGSLVTRDNFLKGIPKNVEYETISKNVELLSCFMSLPELTNYLSSDMGIFSVDNETLHDLVLEVFIKNKNPNDIALKLNDILKNKVGEELKKSNNKKTKEKTDKKSKENNDVHYSVPNVEFKFNEINDFAFDFDLNKLKVFLGKYYDTFISDLKKSGVDSAKLYNIVNQNNYTKNLDSSANKTVDAGMLLNAIHTGYEQKTNRIELLWQLQRNIVSAKNLIKSFLQRGDLDAQKIYVVSSNYFKLAGEKDLYFSHLDMIEEHYKNTAVYLVEKIERSFDELTREFVSIMKQSDGYLNEYSEKLIRQKEIIEKQIKKFSFENMDDSVQDELGKQRQELMALLSEKQYEYENQQKLYHENKFQTRQIKAQIQQEKESPTDRFDFNNLDEKLDLFHFAYVGKRERELHYELDKLLNKKDEIENFSSKLINEISELKKELNAIDEKLKGTEIYNALMGRINELQSRLNYALKVKQNLDNDESGR